MSKGTVLVTGGAGFIGSHVNTMLYRAGYDTVVLDNLSTGYQKRVIYGTFIEGDVGDIELLQKIFADYPINVVIHCAGSIAVGESVFDPAKYYLNNSAATLNLLRAMLLSKVELFLFSSTAAIFGNPVTPFINEDHPTAPINPYGQSKLVVEKMLVDFARAYPFRYCSLRYFNAAGGDPEGELQNNVWQIPDNLIPRILRSYKDQQDPLIIYGTDYHTPDGTCMRDYVHIDDLGRAHILAMEQLLQGALSDCYNLGSGTGYSVREVIQTAEEVLHTKIYAIDGPRREGDPAILLADSTKASKKLGWIPRYTLKEMIAHAAGSLYNESL